MKKKWFYSLSTAAMTVALLGGVPAHAADEPNDTLAEATSVSIQKGTVAVKETIENVSDKDYYKFTLDKPGKVDIRTNLNPNTQYRVTLLTSAERELERFETPLGNDTGVQKLFSQGLDAGTYYVKVERYKGEGNNVPYSLALTYTQSSTFEKEQNNSQSSANEILLNTNYSGFADPDNDYYKFELPSNGEVKIDIAQTIKTRFEVTLLGSGGQEFETKTTDYASSKETIIHTGLPKGTYYLNIKSKEGDTANIPYTFAVNLKANNLFEKEGNGSTSLANEIELDQALQGVISSNTDNDYYRLQLTKSTNFDLYFTQPKSTTFKVEITNQQFTVREELFTEFGNGSQAKIGNLTLPQGIYHIKVEANQGETQNIPYTILVDDTGSKSIKTYLDYRPGEYWISAFHWGLDKNVIKGDAATNRLNPNKNITEAQWLAMLLRYALPNEANDSVNEVWYQNYYKIAKARGIDVTNKPNDALRRGDVAKILAIVYTGKTMTEHEAVQWLYNNEITTGVNPAKAKDYNNFNPNGKITRAHAVTFMYRLDQKGITPKLK